MPSSERRYVCRPERESLPRSLATWIRRSVRSFTRSIASEMMPSATANSGAVRISSSLYSPIQKQVAGKAVSSAARSCRKRRKPLLDQHADPLGDGGEPAVTADYTAEVLVVHGPPDRLAIEEAERLGVAEDLLERLGDRGEVERRTLFGRAGEDELL